MGTNVTPGAVIATLLEQNERDCAWLARKAGINYKRVLRQIKHRKTAISLLDAARYAEALGVELPVLLNGTEGKYAA